MMGKPGGEGILVVMVFSEVNLKIREVQVTAWRIYVNIVGWCDGPAGVV